MTTTEQGCVFAPYGEGHCNGPVTTALESRTYLDGKVASVKVQPACAEHAAYWRDFYSGFPGARTLPAPALRRLLDDIEAAH